jgi:hypothetical protein
VGKTVFTKVDYDLGTLVKYISLGNIGLPDIQRPFVWKNSKVRDLFDSMYKGYPVGYLLFWRNTFAEPIRTIGMEQKQLPPRLVIVDGQQRLTSLYAVINNVPVFRENFKSEHIKIAFNPLEERFEVADAAITKDKSFLPDISILWADDAKITRIIREYLENLRTSREISDKEELVIEDRILRLQKLQGFPFTALELDSDVDEEAVSDVFVRINSKGTPLNQADFILTLMSVFWDEGRADLEQFSRDSRKPAKGVASPFNHFIEPYPDQLLRVGVGVAFKRARLKYVYSILRGKDLETEKFSDERRVQQFELLKDAQNRVLDLQHWHDFMNCVRQAGFRSGKMISSQNNLLFSYVLYLIGRTEYKVSEFDLRQLIARWFFMSSVTGRFTASPESAMEFDLARLRDVKNANEFIETLSHICDITLTGDFWTVSLPNDLATSSPRSPSLFAYQAALVLLDARALFSKIGVSDLLDPSVHANRAAVERHHLFPKAYLNKLGIDSIRDTNQIANYAFVEWGDNTGISDQAPADYLPAMKERFSNRELERMYYWHALPDNWGNMEYHEFLRRRRELMASVIRDAYSKLTGESSEEKTHLIPVEQLVNSGEAVTVEFKSTLRINLHTGEKDPRIELSVLKTIAAFLNSNGGTLIIGVADNGDPVGIEADNFVSEDKMYLHLVNLLNNRLGPQHSIYIHPRFDDYQENRVMVVECLRGKSPVFVKDGPVERFYVRTGAATTELFGSRMQDFIRQRFWI